MKAKTFSIIFIAALAGLLLLARATVKSNGMKKIIKTENAPAPIGPYSQGILVDGTLYISGQIAIEPKNNTLINYDIESETRQVMDNLKAILQEAGMDFTHVVKCTIFLSDLKHFGKFNEVYGSYFNEEDLPPDSHRDGQAGAPARECVQAARLPRGMNVEISAVAVK